MSPRTLPSCMSNANLRPFAKNACSSRRSAQAQLSRLRRRLPKLAGSRSSPLADRELLHPEVADFADVERVLAATIDRVAVAVGDEDIALRVPGDISRTVEDVLLRSRSGRTAAAAASAFAAPARSARTRRILNRFRLAPEEQRDAALRIQFHDHGRHL